MIGYHHTNRRVIVNWSISLVSTDLPKDEISARSRHESPKARQPIPARIPIASRTDHFTTGMHKGGLSGEHRTNRGMGGSLGGINTCACPHWNVRLNRSPIKSHCMSARTSITAYGRVPCLPSNLASPTRCEHGDHFAARWHPYACSASVRANSMSALGSTWSRPVQHRFMSALESTRG